MKRSKRHNRKVSNKDLMSSHCFIAKINSAQEYESVFCADGHPEYTGSTLNYHYKNESKAYQLIQEGDISTLSKDIAQTKFYDEDYGFIRPFNEFETMVDYYRQCGCTYGYIFAKREWNAIHITDTGTNTVKLNSLTNA